MRMTWQVKIIVDKKVKRNSNGEEKEARKIWHRRRKDGRTGMKESKKQKSIKP